MRRRGSKIAKYIERDYKIKKAFENREQKRQEEKNEGKENRQRNNI